MEITDKQTAPALQWQPAPDHPWLGGDDVHLWRAQLEGPCAMPAFRETLTLHEALEAERIPNAIERRHFITSRGLLRMILGGYLQVAPEEVRLMVDDADKLCLAAPQDSLQFDLGESDGLTLVAVSRAREVGLDIERIRENLPFTEMAGHYFEPEETWGVIISRGQERAWKFFDFWTGKEAIRRAHGEPFARHQNASGVGLALNRLSPAEGFTAALAVGGGDFRLACWDWQAAA